MTCKDCICFKMCRMKDDLFFTEEIANSCDSFKDKSRIVELPCKAGDTVYCMYQYNECFGNKDKAEIFKSTVRAFVFEEEKIKIVPSNYSEKTELWYKLLDVFLTRAEAEKALAERNSKDGSKT